MKRVFVTVEATPKYRTKNVARLPKRIKNYVTMGLVTPPNDYEAFIESEMKNLRDQNLSEDELKFEYEEMKDKIAGPIKKIGTGWVIPLDTPMINLPLKDFCKIKPAMYKIINWQNAISGYITPPKEEVAVYKYGDKYLIQSYDWLDYTN